MQRPVLLVTLLVMAPPSVLAQQLERSPAADGAAVYFITPAGGEQVPGEFTVRFGLRSMGVAPAGHQALNTGHHHLLVDLDELVALDQPLPKTEQVLHFGAGQTEVKLSLAPGAHTLQLVLGDHLHIPHVPPLVSEKIMVVVGPQGDGVEDASDG